MQNSKRELTPVIYNSAAVKLLTDFCLQKAGQECFPMHWHERMELLRVRQGAVQVEFGGHKECFGPDTLVIIPPNQPHRGCCIEAPMMYDVIMFDVRSFYNETDICGQYFPPIFEGKSRFVYGSQDPEVLHCADTVITMEMGNLGALAMTAEIYRLLYLLCLHCLREIQPVSPFDQTMKEVVNYIESHFAEPLTTENLSARFRYTKPYFCRRFKECTGLTIMQYINIFRIETARRRLRQGDGSVSQVAEACGFPDANYFTRCFKKHFGYAPSACREP